MPAEPITMAHANTYEISALVSDLGAGGERRRNAVSDAQCRGVSGEIAIVGAGAGPDVAGRWSSAEAAMSLPEAFTWNAE